MPDLSHVGRRYLAPGQVVSAERVAEYASAVSGADEVYSPGSVPPTFAAVYCLLPSLAEVLGDAELGIELAGLCLLYTSLPGMDGLTVTRMLKSDPKTADVPVVALTALSLIHI